MTVCKAKIVEISQTVGWQGGYPVPWEGGRRLGLAVAEEGEEAWLLWVSQDPMAGQSMDWKEGGARHHEPDLLLQESCTRRRPWH